jgi:dihydroxy-acid dehydratase
MQAMEVVRRVLKPLDVITKKSIRNAIAVDVTIGGSSNAVLHLMGIANEAGIGLELEAFDEVSKATPQTVGMMPEGCSGGGPGQAGGIQAIMKRLAEGADDKH